MAYAILCNNLSGHHLTVLCLSGWVNRVKSMSPKSTSVESFSKKDLSQFFAPVHKVINQRQETQNLMFDSTYETAM